MTNKNDGNGLRHCVEILWTDAVVELEALSEPPHRTLLFGAPGTGKTSHALSVMQSAERVTLTPADFPDKLLGKFLLRGGETVWVDGPVVRAMRAGVPVVLDEINRAGSELDSTLQMVMDDLSVCRVNLDNGETVQPVKGYRIIATMNGSPDELAEPVLDRFDCFLRCNVPAKGLLARLSPDCSAFINNAMLNADAGKGDTWAPKISPRRMLAFDHLRENGMASERAAVYAFGFSQADGILTALCDAARNAAAIGELRLEGGSI